MQQATLFEEAPRLVKHTWTPEQHAIFEDTRYGTGHTVVVARAGSGKSSTIAESLNYVPNGKTILMVAFSRIIADELKARKDLPKNKKIVISTLHGLGMGMIKRRFPKSEFVKNKTYDLIDSLMATQGRTDWPNDYKYDLKNIVSKMKNLLVFDAEGVDQAMDYFDIDGGTFSKSREEFIQNALKLLEMSKDPTSNFDFDDMIWFPYVLDLTGTRYDRIFIDETQDLSSAQIDLSLKSVKQDGRICAVGDPFQCIYAFRGADATAVDNVIEALDAKTMSLTMTFRCAKSIVRDAQKIVPDYRYAENASEGVVKRHLQYSDLNAEAKPGDFILSRANAPLVPLCLGFLRNGRPAKILGKESLIDSFLKLIQKSKARDVHSLRNYIRNWKDAEIARLRKKYGEKASTKRATDRADTIIALTEGMVSVEQVVLRMKAIISEAASSGHIVLSTTHQAKGLERDRVFILRDTYCDDDCEEIEEQNLRYVAITRAKNYLFYVDGWP